MRNIKPSPSSLQIIYWTGKSCPFWASPKISSLAGPWSPGRRPPLCSTTAVSEHWSNHTSVKKKKNCASGRTGRTEEIHESFYWPSVGCAALSGMFTSLVTSMQCVTKHVANSKLQGRNQMLTYFWHLCVSTDHILLYFFLVCLDIFV